MNALAPSPAIKTHLDAQVSLLTDMANRMYDAVHRITALNLKLAQQLVDDNLAASRQVMATNDPVERCAALVSGGVPASEHLRGYQQQLLNIIAGTQLELSRSAGEHLPEASRAAGAVADEVMRRGSQAGEKIAAEQRQVIERMAQPGAGADTSASRPVQ